MSGVLDGYLIDSSYETKAVFMESCCSAKFRGQVVLDGYLIRARDLHRESHRSVLVNLDISHIFYLHELMERVGRGTYMIVKECKQLGAKSPSWSQEGGGVQLTIYASTGADASARALNKRQIAALSKLQEGQSIRSSEYAKRFGRGVTERQVRRDLSQLDKLGFLKREGSGPSTVYVRTAKQLESRHVRT